MIPKVIHYIWIGGRPLPEEDKRRIEGWRRLHPGWEIKEWNEKNFDIEGIYWIRAALKRKNYAMASDAIRAKVLLDEGGVYMDTDMELLKPLDPFLGYDNFAGFESGRWFGSAIMGAKKGSEWVEAIWGAYARMEKWTEAPNVHIISVLAKDIYGVKLDGVGREYPGFTSFDREVFYPIHYATGEESIVDATVGVHRYSSTWWGSGQKLAMEGARMIHETRYSEKFDEIAAKAYEKKVRKAFEI